MNEQSELRSHYWRSRTLWWSPINPMVKYQNLVMVNCHYL